MTTFRVLGPVTIESRGQETAPVGQLRSLLVLLLLDAGRPVPGATVVDGIWDGSPPPTAGTAVRGLVSRLRRLIGPDGGTGAALDRVDGGWMLHLPPGALDADRFERAAADGWAAEQLGRLDEAVACYRRAQHEWRGPAFDDAVDDLDGARARAAFLEERRLEVCERRLAAELTLGRAPGLVGELRLLVDAHPYREGFVALLMQALYRSGRQVEALRAYSAARTRLDRELGLRPGPALVRLEQAILDHDASLAPELAVPVLIGPAGDDRAVRPPTRPACGRAGRPVPLAAAGRCSRRDR